MDMSTNIEEVVSQYSKETESLQVVFLSRLAHQITIYARDTYDLDSDSLSKPSQMRSINEMMHRILGQQTSLLLEDKDRYPDDILIKMLFAKAAECEFENSLKQCISDSFKFLTSNKGQTN